MRFVVLLVLLTTAASAGPLDVKKTLAKAEACGVSADALAPLGVVEKVETIAKRSENVVVQLVGKKARGYLVWGETCNVVPVVGKPVAFVKGNFGGGATAAYALFGGSAETGVNVVSLKSGDKLLDVLVFPEDCTNGMSLSKRTVFAGRDSIEASCFASGGADVGRSDHILDAGDGTLGVLLSVFAGIAWVQIPETDKSPYCTARSPGGIKIVTTGDKPVLEGTTVATPEEAEAAKADRQAGGCEQTVITRRFELAGKTFKATGKPRVWLARKLCSCRKQ